MFSPVLGFLIFSQVGAVWRLISKCWDVLTNTPPPPPEIKTLGLAQFTQFSFYSTMLNNAV